MLKIETLDYGNNKWEAGVLESLTGEAVVKLAGVADPVAKGNFRMHNCGMCTMCEIKAAGKWDKGYKLAHPSNLTVELTSVFTRSYTVKEVTSGEASIDTGFKDLEKATKVGSTTELTQADGVVTVPSVDVGDEVELELTVKVATGTASDLNANHELSIEPDNGCGLVAFDILCNAYKYAGRKPNKATLEIRGAKPWKTLGEKQPVEFDKGLAVADDTANASEITG